MEGTDNPFTCFPTQKNTNTQIGKRKIYKKRQRQNVVGVFGICACKVCPCLLINLGSLLKWEIRLIYVRLFVLSNSSPRKKHTSYDSHWPMSEYEYECDVDVVLVIVVVVHVRTELMSHTRNFKATLATIFILSFGLWS